MSVALLIIQILLGIGFIMFGFMKFSSKQMVDEFQRYGYASSFRILTGLIEVTAAVLMIAGIWISVLALIGAILIIGTMIGAIFTHFKVGDQLKSIMMPATLLLLAIAVAVYVYQLISW